MYSGTKKYIMDANAIRGLSYSLIKNKLQTNRLIVTISDVAHEVASRANLELIKIEVLNNNAYEKMAEIINNYQSVRNLVNYIYNKGAADVGMLAYALTIDSGKLCNDDIIIVTNDVGLRLACDDVCVKWMSVDNFKAI